MPLKVAPDPQNPGKLIWVDSATGQPASQPGGPDTPYVAQSDTTNPPGGVNIAPAGSGAVPPAATPAPTTQPTAPAAGPASPGASSSGGYTVSQIVAPSDAEVAAANKNVSDIWGQVQDQQAKVQKARDAVSGGDITQQATLNSEISNLNALYTTYSQALQRVETANASRSKTLTDALHNGTIDPSQVQVAQSTITKADADAGLAHTQADVLEKGSQGQRDLVAAQAGLTSQQAQLAAVQAAAQTAKTPAEKAQLEAQAAALQAQANSTNTLLPGLVDKQKAETGLTVAQTDLTGSQSALAKAQAGQATANAGLLDAQAKQTTAQTTTLLPAQAGLATAQAGLANAQAAGATADTQQKLLGPVYGLQDQLKAIQSIHDQVFGPGGSGTPDQRRQQADDLMSQFFNATVGGTTPYAASVAAANAGLTAYGTQMSGTNALQAAQASRASSYAGLAGTELGTLAGMNAYAPKGSTAMAGAFQYLQDDMAKRMAAQFPTAPIPNAPALPSYLQQFANPAQGAAGPGGAAMPAGAPGAAVAMGAPAAVPGGGPVFNPQASTAAMNTAGFMDTPAGRAAMAVSNPALLASPGGPGAAPAPVTAGAPAAAPGGPPPTLPGMFSKYWQQQSPSAVGQPATGPVAGYGGLTPAQAFGQGFTSNVPTFPNVLQMYGLNMPNPMQLLGGQPYVGMGA